VSSALTMWVVQQLGAVCIPSVIAVGMPAQEICHFHNI